MYRALITTLRFIGGTMDIAFSLRGFAIGFSVAIPVGPISVLCIRRTLAEGRLVGMASGLGVATGDTVYGSIAGFWLNFISNILIGQQSFLRLIGEGYFSVIWGSGLFSQNP